MRCGIGIAAKRLTAWEWSELVQPWQEQLWDLFKIIAPWLTGGLAGAILTYLLNQRIARRRQARILVTTERVDYSVAAKDEQLRELRVSYRGNEFENLLLFQITLENVSSRTVQRSPLLFLFEKETTIVDRSSLVRPINRDIPWIPQEGHESAYTWDAGGLKPGDSARLRILLSSTSPVNWLWRGDDDVEVTSYGREAALTVERELRTVIAWIAVYVSFGVVPFFSSLAHAALLIASMPYIVSYCLRWWSLFTARKGPTWSIRANASYIQVLAGERGGVQRMHIPEPSGAEIDVQNS
jgi:hypothetical protein